MKKTLAVSPSRKELLWGGIYIILELFVLPYLLSRANLLLAQPLSAGKLNTVFFILNFGITTLIFCSFLKRTLLDAGQRFLGILFAAAAGFFLYWAGNLAVGSLVLWLDPEFVNINDSTITAMADADFLPIAICTVFFVPVAEELLFRGVLFAGFYRRSPVIAFLVSAAVFSVIHIAAYIGSYPWYTLLLCFIQYIPPSLALGWAYAKSGSILSPMLMHIVINAVGIFVMR